MPDFTPVDANTQKERIAEGKRELSALLRAIRVGTVVVVDDDYAAGVEPDVLVDLIETLRERGDNETIRELGLDPDSDEWALSIVEAVDGWARDQRLDAYDRLQRLVNGAPVRFRTPLAEMLDGVSLLQLSPDDWERDRASLLGQAEAAEHDQNSRYLFLFDYHLGASPPRGLNGRQLLRELLGLSRYSLFCGIITDRVTIGTEADGLEDEERPAVLVSKERILEYPESFAEGIRRTAIAESVQDLIHAASDAITGAHATALARVREINVNNFERIIVFLSQQEGISEIETLLRVYGIYLRKNARRDLRRQPKVQAAVEKTRMVASVGRRNTRTGPDSAAMELQATEMYEEHDDLNRFHQPLELGDVFEIGTGRDLRSYILLGQPCDLSLRLDIEADPAVEDAERKLASPWLVEIVGQKPDKNSISGHYQLPYFGPSHESQWVRFRSAYPAPMRILDLTAFTRDGVARTQVDKLDPPLGLLRSWISRYRELQGFYRERLAAVRESTRFLEAAAEKGVEVSEMVRLRMMELVASDQVIPDPEVNQDSIVFPVRRLRRIVQPYSGVLLIKFMQYMSREAFEVDLAR